MDTQKILINRPSNRFWYVNLIGWGIAAIINTVLQYLSNTMDLGKAMYGIIPLAWAFIFTAGLRLYWGYRNIYSLSYKELVLILIPHSLIVTVLIVVIGIGNVYLVRNDGYPLLTMYLRNFWGVYPAILLWIALYFGIIHSQNLRKKEIDNLQLQNLLQTAQMSNLCNQLNPHFLFNALNDIKSLIREDGEKARTMLTSLTDILRYSLSSNTKQTVTVVEEIAFVRDFLELEHLHMEERLHCNLRIDERAGRYRVPPMVIQILVENAIKHGISRLPAGGRIDLDVSPSDAQLVIRVTNSGHLPLKSESEGNGLGITNIKSRLRVLYGDNAGFDIREEKGLVMATLKLPIEA